MVQTFNATKLIAATEILTPFGDIDPVANGSDELIVKMSDVYAALLKVSMKVELNNGAKPFLNSNSLFREVFSDYTVLEEAEINLGVFKRWFSSVWYRISDPDATTETFIYFSTFDKYYSYVFCGGRVMFRTNVSTEHSVESHMRQLAHMTTYFVMKEVVGEPVNGLENHYDYQSNEETEQLNETEWTNEGSEHLEDCDDKPISDKDILEKYVKRIQDKIDLIGEDGKITDLDLSEGLLNIAEILNFEAREINHRVYGERSFNRERTERAECGLSRSERRHLQDFHDDRDDRRPRDRSRRYR